MSKLFLNRVTTLFLNSRYFRAAFLNSIMLLVFAAAWASDLWPEFTALALSVAFAIVVGAFVGIYLVARKASSKALSGSPVEIKKQETTATLPKIEAHEVLLHPYEASRLDVMQLLAWHEGSHRHRVAIAFVAGDDCLYGLSELKKIAELRLRASQSRTWQVASARELESWKFSSQGTNAFNVEAGAFVIQYLHGHTRIRVLDPQSVTVESAKRGSAKRGSKDAALTAIWAPVYNWLVPQLVFGAEC